MSATAFSHVLDNPLVCNRLMQYIPVRDALSCIRVCKTWTQHFARAVWQTIDFKTHESFLLLDSAIVQQYRQHIQAIENVSIPVHLESLGEDIHLNRLTSISVLLSKDDTLFNTRCQELIRSNKTSLTALEVEADYKTDPWSVAFPLEVFLPDPGSNWTSKLKKLMIMGFTMPHTSLVTILRSCPALTSLDLWDTVIQPSEDGTEDRYRHLGMTYFILDADNLLVQNPVPGQSKSLLVHFPNLWTLSTYGYAVDTFPSTLLWDEIRQWCPRLRNLETNCTPAPLIAKMLTQASVGLARVHFDYDAAAADIFLSLLVHRKTLVKVSAATAGSGFYGKETVPEVKDPLEGETWIAQCIPQQCSQLEELFLPEHAMNMDEVEKKDWQCRGLKDLRIRVQGLDTAEAIDRVVATWNRRRRVKLGLDLESRSANAERTGPDAAAEERDMMTKEHPGASLEERVVRHLLKFDKLKSVWLGKAVHRLS
ncbi:hypothetical protein EC968_001661 [Mortierella alpina]|nr:hypothetical protein EC968_001661 [Mortierella alpina]